MEFTLTEKINPELLNKIYCINQIKKCERVRLLKLVYMLSENGTVKVPYKQNLYNKNPYGRFMPQLNMNGTYMNRRARATLYGDVEYDIDLVCAHQSIAKYIVNREKGQGFFEINYPVLNRYITNRDDVINEFKIPQDVIDFHNNVKERHDTQKDFVKTLVTILLYGGKIDEWYSDFDISPEHIPKSIRKNFISPLQKELNLLITFLIGLDKYKNLVDDVKKQKRKDKKDFHNGSICSIILQEEEAIIVKSCIDIVKRTKKDFVVSVYAYDGFQVRHKQSLKDEETDAQVAKLINKINNFVEDKFNTTALKFINKPFAEPFTEEELKDVDPVAQFLAPYFINTNIDELKYYVKHLIKDKTIMTADSVFHYNGCVWKQETKDFYSKLVRDKVYKTVKTEVNSYFDNTDKEDQKTIKSITNQTSIKYIKPAIQEALNECINNYVEFDEKPHLLNATNGTYNLDTFTLQPHNPDDYLTKCINFPINENKICKKSLRLTREKIKCWFDDGTNTDDEVNELTNLLIQYAGKSLHGKNFTEKAIVLIGKLSRNGKSTFMGLLKDILNDYHCVIPMKYFTSYEKGGPSPEVVKIKGCRILQVDEGGGEEQRLIPENFKKIVGGDRLSGRNLYSNKIHSFISQGLLWFIVNYNIHFTVEGNDTTGKLEYFDFNVKFGEEGDLGWDETKPNHKKIDYQFKHSLTDAFKQTMLHAMLYQQKQSEIMKPEKFKFWNKSFKGEVDTVGTWIAENILYDPDDIYFIEDDYAVKNYDNIRDKFFKLQKKNKKMVRQITTDFLYKRYEADLGENSAKKKVFLHNIKIAFKDLIPNKKTVLFGGKKNYIEKVKYIGFNEDDEEDCEC